MASPARSVTTRARSTTKSKPQPIDETSGMSWREERALLNAWLGKKSKFPKPLDTAKRVARKRKKQRAVEKVVRWQQRHPRTYARKMRVYRARKKRAAVTASKADPAKMKTALEVA